MTGGDQCFLHDPAHAAEAAEARRLGGVRRRREGTIRSAFDLGPLDTPAGIRRVLEIATTDSLGLDNGIARSRTLIAAASAAARLLEVSDLDARLRALEAVAHQAESRSPLGAADSLLDEDD